MKILLAWNCDELDRGKRGSLSKAKYEVDVGSKKVEFLDWDNEISFE